MTSANDPGNDAPAESLDSNIEGTRQPNGAQQQGDGQRAEQLQPPGQSQPSQQSGTQQQGRAQSQPGTPGDNSLQQQGKALQQQGEALQQQASAMKAQGKALQQQGNDLQQGRQPSQSQPQQVQPQASQQQPQFPQRQQPSVQNQKNVAAGSQQDVDQKNASRPGSEKQPPAGQASSINKGGTTGGAPGGKGASDKDSNSDKSGKKGEADKADKKDGGEEKKKFLKPIVIVLIIVVLIGLVIFQFIRNKPEGKSGWLRISGRIEGYEVNVGAKIAGRVEAISNREGDEVKYLQPLVRLSDDDIRAQLRGARARWEEAISSVKEAEALLNVSREQVSQAKLNVTQAREDARGRIEQAEANVATQKAQLSQAQAQEVQAKADLALAAVRQKRYDELVVRGAVTQDEDDQAHSTYESTVATVDARKAAVVAAQKQVYAADAALVQAKSNSLNPPIRLSQQVANTRTVTQNEAALLKAKQDVKNAKAAVEEIEANIAYLNINSPIHGVVTARTVEPGAVVAAGQTVISLINLDTVFLRAYVPDSEIGKVRLQQKALIYYDSDYKHGISGRVIEIDPQASFTPENIYFRDDRVKQVFGIKILIDNPSNYAKPGMPADADIDIQPASGAKNS